MRPLRLVAPFAAIALFLSAAAHAGDSPAFSVPFQDDDYAKAIAEAQQKGVPVFVESWAPW